MTSAQRSGSSRVSRGVAVAAIVALAVLASIYRWLGDSTLEGEMLTVWPPELWAGAFTVLALLVALADRRYGAAVFVATFVFLLATSEWASLFRKNVDPRVVQVQRRLPARDVERGPVAGPARSRTAAAGPLPLPGERARRRQSDDLGLLEGLPLGGHPRPCGLQPLSVRSDRNGAGRSVGSSAGDRPPPPIGCARSGGERTAGSARDVMKIASPSDAIDLRAHHRGARGAVRAAIEGGIGARQALGGVPAIVCGDFNTPGSAVSVRGLSPLTDIWPRAGRGWGGTMGDDLPIARIDQCWASEGVHPCRLGSNAVVVRTTASWSPTSRFADHRFWNLFPLPKAT